MSIKFGPAGQSMDYTKKTSLHYPKWLNERGLTAFEYQCGKGVLVGEETARAIGAQAKEHDVQMSLHAPYFINLGSPEEERQEKNLGYILKAFECAEWMGATRVVVHPGGLMKRERRAVMDLTLPAIKRAVDVCDAHGYGHIHLCMETMGKINQLGDLDEVLEMCQVDERILPCIDFGHLYARTFGELDGEDAMIQILDRMQNLLGEERASKFHSHFSKIAFTIKGGEKMHLTFDQDEFGPQPEPLMKELAKRKWSPVLICESAGTQSQDALYMKQIYEQHI